MNILTLNTGTLQLLGWSLLHFLWQGTILALLLGIALAAARNGSPQTRYALCCATLTLMALSPVATFAYLAHGTGPAVHGNLPAAVAEAEFPAAAQPWQAVSLLTRMAVLANQSMPWILSVWLMGVLLFLTRAIIAGIAAERLKTASIIPAPEELLALARRAAERLSITQAFHVFSSQAVTAPTVIGWLRPVILFPVASLAGLAPEQLEAMLAHELAHIRRRDYLVNALQIVIETLLFYHPAVWWVSRCIRRERELCCDDIAVTVTGSPLIYAKALYLLEEQRALAPQLTLGGNGGQLTMRIKRLLTGRQSAAGSYGGTMWLLTAALLFLAAALAVSTTTISKAHAQNPLAHVVPDGNTDMRMIPWGDAVKFLQRESRIPPVYPEIAKAAHVSGEVRILLAIGASGDVKEANVVSGPLMLRQAALDSVIHYKFSPFPDADGQSIATVVSIFFSLGGDNEARPDLSCTYYDSSTTAHPGTCEQSQSGGEPQYLCRQNDENQQTQLQSSCKQKLEAVQSIGYQLDKQ